MYIEHANTLYGGIFMFTVNYSDFANNSFYKDFAVSYMTGLKVMSMDSAKVVINVDSKSAYVYWE